MADYNLPEELPLGFMMQLGMDAEAMTYFSNLSEDQKASLVAYMKGASTGEEAKARIEETLTQLHNHNSYF